MGDGVNFRGNNDHGAQNIEDGHEGHQLGGDLSDSFDTAYDHQKYKNTDDKARDDFGDPEIGLDGLGNGIGLHHVADTEGGDYGKKCKKNPQPFLPQSFLQVVHGTRRPPYRPHGWFCI